MPLEERALADLVDVSPVGLHAEQIRHDVPVAAAILRLAGRGKRDRVIREVKRVEVVHFPRKGKLVQTGPIAADFVEVVAVGDIRAHRKDHALPIEMNFGITHHALGSLQQRPHRAVLGKVNQLEGTPRRVLPIVVFTLGAGEESGRVMMVPAILPADHKEDRLTTDERIGHEGFALQTGEISRVGALLKDCQSAQKFRPARVASPMRGHQIGDGLAKGIGFSAQHRHRQPQQQQPRGPDPTNGPIHHTKVLMSFAPGGPLVATGFGRRKFFLGRMEVC